MRKWLVLLSYAGAAFINGSSWAVLITIPDQAMSYYNIGQAEMTLYSYIYSVLGIPLAPFTAWLISKSYFTTIHTVWVFSLIGSWVRFFAFRHFWISFIGQSLIGVVNLLIFSSCTTMTVLWFPPSLMVLVISLSTAANFIGMGFIWVYMPNFPNISQMMLIQACFCSFFWILNLLVMKKDKKKIDVLSFRDSIHMLLKIKLLLY